MTISVDQLRLGVAFAHAVPTALLTIRLDRGRSLRCSHDAGLAPDLHPCQARQLLVSTYSAGEGDADWVSEVAGLDLGGPRLVAEGGGLYRAWLERGVAWCFATLLCPLDARDLVEEVMGRLFAEHGLEADEDRLAALGLRADIDRCLGVVVVTCPETPSAAEVSAEAAMRQALSACLVAELCGAVTADRGLR